MFPFSAGIAELPAEDNEDADEDKEGASENAKTDIRKVVFGTNALTIPSR